MPYKIVTKKRQQYILFVVDRYKGVLKIMHPEETTIEELKNKQFKIQLSTTDLLALASMKNVAKCDK